MNESSIIIFEKNIWVFALKKTIGLYEKIKIIGAEGVIEADAMVDTGASSSSLDYKIAAKAGVGPIISSVRIKSAFKHHRRPVARVEFEIDGKSYKSRANLEDRSNRTHQVILGRNVIKYFLVDIHPKSENKKIIGITKKIKVGNEIVVAKFDTGASQTSIDRKLAKKIGFNETGKIKVGNAVDSQKRVTGPVEITIKGKKFNIIASISERSHMKIPVLIGRDIIKSNFIIDVERGE